MGLPEAQGNGQPTLPMVKVDCSGCGMSEEQIAQLCGELKEGVAGVSLMAYLRGNQAVILAVKGDDLPISRQTASEIISRFADENRLYRLPAVLDD